MYVGGRRWESRGVHYVLAVRGFLLRRAFCDPASRNHGYGGCILLALRAHLDTQYAPSIPFVLEVEMPTDDLSRRRIAFYERHGFALWKKCAYMQPPYRPTDEPLPMLLMVEGRLDEGKDFLRVKETIHKEVYGVCFS